MKFQFSLDKLIGDAIQETGLFDFGDPDIVGALHTLLESYNTDVPFSEFGFKSYCSRLHIILCNRLRIAEDRKRFPGIAEEKIERPIFISGLPRSGTSFLLDVIARDQGNRSPRTWEIFFSSPPPEKATYSTDPRISLMESKMAELGYTDPDLLATHPFAANAPEEDTLITEQSFISHALAANVLPATQYTQWLVSAADHGLAYRHHRQVLQHLQYRYRGERWALKSPGHTAFFELLLQEYPDALIVEIHRDPAKVIPSLASMGRAFHNIYLEKEEIDPKSIGQNMAATLAVGIQQAIDARARINRPNQFFDVVFDDLRRDPLGIVEQIYSHFDLTLSSTTRESIQQFVSAGQARHGHGQHSYSLPDYGLEASDIHRELGFYIEKYNIQTTS